MIVVQILVDNCRSSNGSIASGLEMGPESGRDNSVKALIAETANVDRVQLANVADVEMIAAFPSLSKW